VKIFNYMKKRASSRGLSPVIASVLLILLVLVLAAMIFLWARGFIGEQVEKFGEPINQICESVDFEIEMVGNDLEVVNRGNVDIYYLSIKMIKGGDSEFKKFDFSVDAGESVRESVSLLMENNVVPDEVIVYPALIGNVKDSDSNLPFTCLDFGRTL